MSAGWLVRRPRRRRAVLALMVLFTGGAAQAEQVVGELRDGAVHHESVLEAAVHAATAHGDHGHEDRASDQSEHGTGHSHGSTGDHCTHQHGPPVPCTFLFALAFTIGTTSFTHDLVLTPTSTSSFLRPPSLG